MAHTSAVLDVVIENSDYTTILKEKESEKSTAYSIATFDNSLVQSPSIESFSTMQDIENLSELNMDENSDLCIKIDNPQKHFETIETFITFRVITKVARIEFSENEYVVRRRYNDFLWLRQKLLETYPFCIIPPIPAKHSLIGQLDRYSKDFILVRMRALDVFISRIVQHPILSCSEHFKIFITANQPDFNIMRRKRSSFEKVLQSTTATLNHVSLKNKCLEFDKIKTYLSLLTDKITSIERISSRINKERMDLVTELQFFYPILITWASSEPELNKILINTGSALEKIMTSQNNLVLSYQDLVTNPVKDFINYVDVAQEALKKRELYQASYEGSIEELNKKRTEKDKLLSSGQQQEFTLWKQQSLDEKLEKIGTCIPQLLKKVETNQDSLECANEQLRSDVERWQLEKQQLLKKILLDFANKQVEYYEKSVNAWENVRISILPSNN